MDEESPQGGSESAGSAIAFGVVAVLVCLALMALFIWQPWSPAPPARPGISSGDAH
jgi:hypothetical protein